MNAKRLLLSMIVSGGVMCVPTTALASAMNSYPWAWRNSANYDTTYLDQVGGSGGDTQGGFVVTVQQMLVELGYTVSVDGGYGSQTEAAIKSFQQTCRDSGDPRYSDMAVDGIVGPETWAAFQNYVESASTDPYNWRQVPYDHYTSSGILTANIFHYKASGDTWTIDHNGNYWYVENGWHSAPSPE